MPILENNKFRHQRSEHSTQEITKEQQSKPEENRRQKAGWDQGGVGSIKSAAHHFQRRDKPLISRDNGLSTIRYGASCRGNPNLL